MAALIVIGAATGDTKAIIHHGENGILFSATDGVALADCLRLLRRSNCSAARGDRWSSDGH